METDGRQFQVLKVNRYEVEENAVFLDYTLQVLLKEIANFKQTTIYVRQSMSKNLKTIEDVLIKQDKSSQFDLLLEKMSHDNQQIQMELIRYLEARQKADDFKQIYVQRLEKPLKNLIKGPYLQIKQFGCNILSELTHHLEPESKKQIIQFAKQLALSDDQENKIVSLQLLAKLGPDLDMDQRKHIYKESFIITYASASVRVKKQIILEIGRLATYLDNDFIENQIIKNFYIKQTQQSAWGIRKSCVEIMTSLLENIKNEKSILSNILLQFVKDGNKFVRVAAHKIIPEFLAKYGESSIPQKIFDIYIHMIDLDINNQVSKLHEIIINVAYYFPGVLTTAGIIKWPHMKGLFNRLLHYKNQEVKLPLASSLHEISKIIGPQYSKQYLFPALDILLKDQSDKIKLNAIMHLAKFVERFDKVTRQNLIDVFLVLQKDPKKWRVRFLIAIQLQQLVKLYEPQAIFKYILPISLKLCNDNVSEVRHQASLEIIYVLNELKKDENLYSMAVESVKGYAQSQKYIQRQTFCMMLPALFQTDEQFHKNYAQQIKRLVNDKIALVRISLAISIRKLIKQHDCKSEEYREYVNKLREDEQVGEYLQNVWESNK